jgi:hypothetical protein
MDGIRYQQHVGPLYPLWGKWNQDHFGGALVTTSFSMAMGVLNYPRLDRRFVGGDLHTVPASCGADGQPEVVMDILLFELQSRRLTFGPDLDHEAVFRQLLGFSARAREFGRLDALAWGDQAGDEATWSVSVPVWLGELRPPWVPPPKGGREGGAASDHVRSPGHPDRNRSVMDYHPSAQERVGFFSRGRRRPSEYLRPR